MDPTVVVGAIVAMTARREWPIGNELRLTTQDAARLTTLGESFVTTNVVNDTCS